MNRMPGDRIGGLYGKAYKDFSCARGLYMMT